MSQKQPFTLLIRNPEGVVFEGDVFALSSTNENGPFDILSDHENFISLVQKKVTLHLSATEKKDIEIQSGILKAHANRVEVYLGVELL